jgi:hypothetical protein
MLPTSKMGKGRLEVRLLWKKHPRQNWRSSSRELCSTNARDGWTLHATVTEPFYAALSRKVQILPPGAIERAAEVDVNKIVIRPAAQEF